jgi:phage baseplate assembly protein W
MTSDELTTLQADLHSLLSTNWGERPMHFSFGCNLREFLFEQKRDEELKEKISDRVVSQLSLWMPFVSVKTLHVFFSEDDPAVPENGIGVFIEFFLTNKPDLEGRTFIVI